MRPDPLPHPMGMANRRIWLWLGGAALCLLTGYAGMRFRQGSSSAPEDSARPSLKAVPRIESGGIGLAPVPKPSAEPAARPVESAPAPEAAGGRTQEDWLKLLAALAGADYARQHPGVLEKLAALLVAHPGNEVWEAGAVTFLARDLEREAATAFWERAAEALPGNLAISDKLIRTALVNLGYGQSSMSVETRAKLDALLARQSLRTPKDPQVAWLRAWVAFEDGRGEDAEGLLKAAMAFPVWQEKAGFVEWGGLEVREALQGSKHPLVWMGELAATQLPQLSKMKDLSRKAVKSAQVLQSSGESERARGLLEATDAMGRGVAGGSRMLISHLVGQAMQRTVIKALRDQAIASGNLAAQNEADRRTALLDADQEAVRVWNQSESNEWNGVERIFQRVGVDLLNGETPSEQALQNAYLLLTDEELRQLNQMASFFAGGELAAFRAWKAQQESLKR